MRAGLPPGYRLRSATHEDIPAVVAVATACDLADIGEVDVFENWVHDEWRRPRFDLPSDAWIVTAPGGEVVAGAYTWDEEPHTLFDTSGWVHPGHRRRGIGTTLALAVEGRAVRGVAEIPAGSAVRVLQSFDADASGERDPEASGAKALFEGLGYAPEREYLHMRIDVPERFHPGGAPAGITIRPRVEADDRAIVAVMAEAFDDPWDYEEARQEFLTSKAYDPSLWVVALDGNETAAALFGYVANGRGQISALGVREAWRRRGIASAVLRASFAMFRDRGVADVRLNVDRDNASGATHLYERAGMRLRRRWLVVAKTVARASGGPDDERRDPARG